MRAIVSPAPARSGPHRPRNMIHTLALCPAPRIRIARVPNNSWPAIPFFISRATASPAHGGRGRDPEPPRRRDKEDDMRKHFLQQAAGAATLMGVLAMAGVPAQAAEIRAKVPFSFEVN